MRKENKNATSPLLLGNDFEQLYNSLRTDQADQPKILSLCRDYRNHFEYAIRLLDLLKNNSNTKIERLAIHLQNGRPSQGLLAELENVHDKRVDFLKGMYFLKNKNYEDALFCFNKISYKLGIEICQLSLSPYAAKKSTDIRIKIYTDSSYWKDEACKNIEGSKNLMYRLGVSGDWDDADNLDTVLATIEKRTEAEITEAEGRDMLKELDARGDVTEIVHLRGKIYHLMKDYRNATAMYKAALRQEPGYLPSAYNLCRIEGHVFDGKTLKSNVSDYNALIRLKSLNFNIDTSKCSKSVGKLVFAIKQARSRNPQCLEFFESNLDQLPLNKAALYNNMAILCEDKGRAMKYLSKAIEKDTDSGDAHSDAAGKYSDAINYNMGVASGDKKYFENSKFPQSELYIGFIRGDPTTGNDLLNAYISKSSPDVRAPESNRNNFAFVSAIRGQIFLEKNEVEAAIKEYSRSARYSTYSLNGLAVCYAIQGHFGVAIKLLDQVADKPKYVQENLINCYILSKDYYAAITQLLRMERTVEVQELIKKLAKEDGGSKAIALCRRKGILKDDSEEQEELLMDEERKGKIKELENFKRQLTFK